MQTACRRGNFGDNIKTDLLGIGSVHVLSPERERERERERNQEKALLDILLDTLLCVGSSVGSQAVHYVLSCWVNPSVVKYERY